MVCDVCERPTPVGRRYCSKQCLGRAGVGVINAAKRRKAGGRKAAGTQHALERGEAVEVFYPGQGSRGGDWWPGVVRDFRRRYPLSRSDIRVWILPRPTEGILEGYTRPVPCGDARHLR